MSKNAIGQALDALSAHFTATPEAAKVKTPAAVSTIMSGFVCETRGQNGEVIRTDMPAPMGGTGTAPNPGWLLRAALSSCAATGITARAARLGFNLTTLEVSVQGEADLRGTLGVDPSVSAALTGHVMKRVRAGSRGLSKRSGQTNTVKLDDGPRRSDVAMFLAK